MNGASDCFTANTKGQTVQNEEQKLYKQNSIQLFGVFSFKSSQLIFSKHFPHTAFFLWGFHLLNNLSAQCVTPHHSSDINWVQVYCVGFRSARQPVENCNLRESMGPADHLLAQRQLDECESESWRWEMTCSNMSSVSRVNFIYTAQHHKPAWRSFTDHSFNYTDKKSLLMESCVEVIQYI